jgi:hypothetical protein
MSQEKIQIRTEPATQIRAARKKSRSPGPWVLTAVLAVTAGVVGIAAVVLNTSGTEDRTRVAAGVEKANKSIPTPAAANQKAATIAAREQVVDDPKGELLWISPTQGAPLSLAYVPAGTQCLVHLRPALIAAHPEGERVLAALGPWGQDALARLRTMLGVELAEVDSLLIAVIISPDGQLDACFRATLTTKWDEEELVRRFPDGKAEQHAKQSYRVLNNRAYFLTPAATSESEPMQRALVVCPANLAPELIDSRGESPALVRDIEALAAHADADRAVTVIVAPKFLQAGGNELLVETAAPLHDALQWLVENDATAISLSAHWTDNFFAELRAAPALNVPPRRLAALLRERIAAAPDAVEEIVLASPWHPYGRKVLARLPGMLRALARYSRGGEEDRQALVRCYLPPMAGHNLLMAGELLLTQPRNETPVSPASAKPATLEQRLAKKTSLAFTKDSLERALEMLAEDTGLEITIQGADLQLDGITKNQSLALDLRDRSAGEILVEILRRANPDRTAAGPSDPRQKLVYTMEPGLGVAGGRFIDTTRTAA